MDNMKELSPEEMEIVSGGASGGNFDWDSVIPDKCPNPNCHNQTLKKWCKRIDLGDCMIIECMDCHRRFTITKDGKIR